MPDDEQTDEELAGTSKIDGAKIDHIIIKWKPSAGTYPLPQSTPTEPAAPAPATDQNTEDTTPAKPPEPAPPAAAPEEAALKADIEEVKAVKSMLANKVIASELAKDSGLDVEARKKELMALKFNDITKLITPDSAPDEPGDEDYTTSVPLSGSQPNTPQTLRDIVQLGLDNGVL